MEVRAHIFSVINPDNPEVYIIWATQSDQSKLIDLKFTLLLLEGRMEGKIEGTRQTKEESTGRFGS